MWDDSHIMKNKLQISRYVFSSIYLWYNVLAECGDDSEYQQSQVVCNAPLTTSDMAISFSHCCQNLLYNLIHQLIIYQTPSAWEHGVEQRNVANIHWNWSQTERFNFLYSIRFLFVFQWLEEINHLVATVSQWMKRNDFAEFWPSKARSHHCNKI